eukprot:2135435-Amphidinium_carterae.1
MQPVVTSFAVWKGHCANSVPLFKELVGLNMFAMGITKVCWVTVRLADRRIRRLGPSRWFLLKCKSSSCGTRPQSSCVALVLKQVCNSAPWTWHWSCTMFCCSSAHASRLLGSCASRQGDRELVKLCVGTYGAALSYASEALQEPRVALKVGAARGVAGRDLSDCCRGAEAHRDDPEIVGAALSHSGAHWHAHLNLVCVCVHCFTDLSAVSHCFSSPVWIIDLPVLSGLALEFASRDLQGDRDLVMKVRLLLKIAPAGNQLTDGHPCATLLTALVSALKDGPGLLMTMCSLLIMPCLVVDQKS